MANGLRWSTQQLAEYLGKKGASAPCTPLPKNIKQANSQNRLPTIAPVSANQVLIEALSAQIRDEDSLQIACIEYARSLEPIHPVVAWLFHPANGGKRPKGVAGRLKAMGVKKGVPDLLLNFGNGRWRGLAIEMKWGKNNTTLEQNEWLSRYQAEGYLIGICWSLGDFMQLMDCYLEG